MLTIIFIQNLMHRIDLVLKLVDAGTIHFDKYVCKIEFPFVLLVILNMKIKQEEININYEYGCT